MATKKTEVEVAEVAEKETELKLPCSATDCDAIPMSIRTKRVVTIYEVKVGNKYRYGTNSWGLPPVRKHQTSGLQAYRLLTHIKENVSPVGTLESLEPVTL